MKKNIRILFRGAFQISYFFLFCSFSNFGQVNPVPSPYVSTVPLNYVRTWEAVKPETNTNNIGATTTPDQFKMQTQYSDGLGRPIETVIKQGSFESATGSSNDLVISTLYDGFGREQFKYLPFVANNNGGNSSINDGLFKLNPFQEQAYFYSDGNPLSPIRGQGETYYYNQTVFESSPLSRITQSMPSGNNWVGANRGVSIKYFFNTALDSVRVWSVTDNVTLGNFGSYASNSRYPAGQLYKTITIDEHGKQVIEFKDKDEKVILKKIQLTASSDNGTGISHNGWLCTYYIYDDLDNLRCVIQPKGVEQISSSWGLTDPGILSEFCFRYEFDARRRLIVKKVPGAGKIVMVYDTRDRVCMMQDSNLIAQSKWKVNVYDTLNRIVQTGLLLNSWNNKSFLQNLKDAALVVSYPFSQATTPSSVFYEILSISHYDDYTGIPSPLANTINYANINNSNFITTYNSSPDFAQQIVQSSLIRGVLAWSQSKIIGSASKFISQVNFYDYRLKLVQTQTVNQTSGVDIATNQYDFSGKTIRTHYFHQKLTSPTQTYQLATKIFYDLLGRLVEIDNSWIGTSWARQVKLSYDALGQVKSRGIGRNPFNTSLPLETLNFDYNIRGWLLGANRDFAKTNGAIPQYFGTSGNYFGFDLGYDKNTIAPTGSSSIGTYATPAYNGNIEGTVWKSIGDGRMRKYDFKYDAANRLLKADFNQYNTSFNKNDNIDFSVTMGDGANATSAYDANGNIMSMTQKGLLVNSSATIDQLTYSYNTNSNKLLKVQDAITAQNKLGDFNDGANGSSNDYNYDGNGNLTLDNNKAISSITYNYLNLPAVITITGKGTITYTYDAGGNKLQKVTQENNASVPLNDSNYTTNITTTSTYINSFVYESKSYSNASLSSLNYTDVLQFVSTEEGRINAKFNSYEFYLKDHLGNVRMMLKEYAITNYYPAATLEGTYDASSNSMVNNERKFYNISSSYIVPETSIPSWGTETTANTKLYYNNNGNPPPNTSYPSGCTPIQTDGSNKLYKLNAATNKTGLEYVIKVMAGDKIDIFGKSYYLNTTNITNANSTTLNVASLMSNFLLAPANAAVGKGFTSSILNTINAGVIPGSFFRGSNNEAVTQVPKAYINYLFLDEQFKYVGGNASRVGASGTVKDHWASDAVLQNIIVPKNGYIFVYVSNESNFDVFFDNLQVVHKPGALLEETHYYPFGLTMAGISSKAANITPNKDKTFQGQKFDDDLGINYVEFKYRNHDPQIGRFIEIDPLADEYVYNSTYAFSENHVTTHVELEGLEKVHFMDNPVEWVATLGQGFSKGEGDLYKAVDWVNRTLNPLVDAYHAVVGKDFVTNEPLSRTDAVMNLGISLIPGGKVEGALVKMEERTAVKETVKSLENGGVHANSKLSTKPATLYRLETKEGNYLKTGITSNTNIEKRYTNTFMKDKRMIPLDKGTRAEMLIKERKIVETNPGPLNKEPWAGKIKN